MEKQSAIFTPVYRQDHYMHHECSECKAKFDLKEQYCFSYYGQKQTKFCPNCGAEIIRYNEIPKQAELFDYSFLEPISKFYYEFKRKLEYYLHIQLSKEEKKEIEHKCNYLLKQEEIVDYNNLYKITRACCVSQLSDWDKRKLKEKSNE